MNYIRINVYKGLLLEIQGLIYFRILRAGGYNNAN